MSKILLVTLSALIFISCSNSTLHTESSNPKKDPFDFTPESEKIVDTGLSKEAFRPSLDILFVIDDSVSMDPHQKNLSKNIDLFTDAIIKTKFLDYHIGVISSTTESGSNYGGGAGGGGYPGYYGNYGYKNYGGRLAGNPPYVDRFTPDGVNALAKNLLVGIDGSTTETFFDPISMALDPNNSANAGFIRQNAPLAIIIITDTDDQSSTYFNAAQFYQFLVQKKGSPDKIFVGAAFVPDPKNCAAESDVNVTRRLLDFFKLTNAQTFSLCDPDYGLKLAAIGQRLANTEQTMYLKAYPQKSTIRVTMNGVDLPNDMRKGWMYIPSNNSIKFGPDIDWDSYPDGAYPLVEFENIPSDNKK